MTYDILAERTGLAKGTLHNIGGQRGYNATLKTIALICRELSTSPGELLELIDDPPKAKPTPSKNAPPGKKATEAAKASDPASRGRPR